MSKAKATHFLNSIRRRRLSSLLQMESSSSNSERFSFKPVLRWNPHVQDYFIKAYGAERFSRISEALTRPSCYSCIRVNTLRTTSDNVIEKLIGIMRRRESERIMNSVENDGFAGNDNGSLGGELNISKCEFPGLDYVVFVKGTGPHEIDYGYENGRLPKEVLVSRKCAEAVLRGAQVYVPGVVACSAHVEKGDTVAVSVAVEQPLSDSSWGLGITRGTVLQGTPADPFYSERIGLYIGQGIAKLSRAGIFRASQGIAVDMDSCIFKLPSFYDVLEGDIFLQNLPSIITAHALDPQRGERILDMCAAPGGKTTAIAMLMKDEGEVVAADRSHNKVLDVQNLAAEMGLSCIVTYKLDALKSVCRSKESNGVSSSNNTNNSSNSSSFCTEKICSVAVDGLQASSKAIKENASDEKTCKATHDGEDGIRKNTRRMKNASGRNQCQGGRVEKSKGFIPDSFDRVLLDAPCSALGLRPRLFTGVETVISLRSHAKYQKKMFDQAVQLVRPGGVLVYSTCTINPGENEALVRYALDKYKFLSLAPQHPRIGGPGLVGQCEFPDGYIEEWLRPGEEELVQRFDPSASLDTIGFFIAKFHVGSKDV